MRTLAILLLCAAVPAMAVSAPAIPDGPVTYNSVSYDSSTGGIPSPAAAPTASGPISAPSSEYRGCIGLNLYTSNYQVRGMGVTNRFSCHGWTSVRASYIPGSRNLFHWGVRQRISGEFGIIWDARNYLGDTPLFNLNYGLGKEIFPNLVVELGYSLHRGGMEGLFSKWQGHTKHRLTQDFNLTFTYDDHQRGFFGHALLGIGVYGLTGPFMDFELGYRFTDLISSGNLGLDLETSAGMAPSFGYWGGGVEGIDAYRLRFALAPYTKSGSIGRDAHLTFKPWLQFSWAGSNKSKIRRAMHAGPIDGFQTTVGVEGAYRF